MKKLILFPLRMQLALCAAWLLPWVAFAALATDILPESCRFQKWPAGAQAACQALFCIFVVADALFTVWYVFLRSHNDPPPGDKNRD
jgi:hypothetical protein